MRQQCVQDTFTMHARQITASCKADPIMWQMKQCSWLTLLLHTISNTGSGFHFQMFRDCQNHQGHRASANNSPSHFECRHDLRFKRLSVNVPTRDCIWNAIKTKSTLQQHCNCKIWQKALHGPASVHQENSAMQFACSAMVVEDALETHCQFWLVDHHLFSCFWWMLHCSVMLQQRIMRRQAAGKAFCFVCLFRQRRETTPNLLWHFATGVTLAPMVNLSPQLLPSFVCLHLHHLGVSAASLSQWMLIILAGSGIWGCLLLCFPMNICCSQWSFPALLPCWSNQAKSVSVELQKERFSVIAHARSQPFFFGWTTIKDIQF